MSSSAFKSGDLFAVLGLSLSIYMLTGPFFVGLGALGIVLMQLTSFALPALVLAATRERGWQGLGCTPFSPGIFIAATMIGCSLWCWNALWITPIGENWQSVEQFEEFTNVLALSDRSFLESLLLFALVPAVCEELLHRGVIAPLLAKRLGFAAGLLLSSLIFGLSHFNLARLLPTAVLGMAAGFVRLKSGSVYPAIALHFLYNACLLVATQADWVLTAPVAAASVGATTIAVVYIFKRL